MNHDPPVQPRVDRPLVSPVIVGRGSYLDALESALTMVAGGRGGTVLVSGEAGVGKSRLLSEAEARAERRGMAIVRGNCWENDRALPYAPVLDLLRSLLFAQSSHEQAARWQPYAPELVKLLPELSGFVPDLEPSPPLEPEQEKRRLFDALCGLLGGLAAERPLMVAIEDVHWADDVSLEFLLYAARQVKKQGVLFVITYREGENIARLSRWLAALDRERLAIEMRLGRLRKDEVDVMVQAIFDLGRPARGVFLDALYTLTEGNPFFIEETLKSLVHSGGIYLEDGVWERKPVEELSIPRSVQDAVARRVEGLDEAARKTLVLAAVIGRWFDFPLLQALTGHDEDLLLGDIKGMIAAQLVVEVSEDVFSFRHALTQRAIYVGLLARERRAIHREIARTIEALHAESREAHLSDLAYHTYEGGLWAEAFDYSRRAGERAQALYAPQSAIELYSWALDAAGRLHNEAPVASANPEWSAGLWLARGSQYEILGEFDHARADYEQALDIARHSGDLAHEWRALIQLGKLWAGRDYSRSGEHFQEALALARRLGEPTLIAYSLNRVGNWALNVEQMEELTGRHEEALEIFRRLHDRQGEIETLDLLGISSLMRGDMRAAARYYRSVLPLVTEVDDKRAIAGLMAILPVTSAYTYQTDSMVGDDIDRGSDVERPMALPVANRPPSSGQVADSRREMGIRAREVAREIGLRSGEAFALAMIALYYGMRGEYAEGLKSARTALQIAEEIGHSQWTSASLVQIGTLLCDLYSFEQAREILERAVQLARETGSQHWLRLGASSLAESAIGQGNLDYARQVLDSVLSGESPLQTMGQRRVGVVRVRLALAEGDAETALRGIGRLFATAPGLAGHNDPGSAMPRISMFHAEAFLMLGRYTEAETAIEAALRGIDRLEAWSLRWQVGLLRGKLYGATERHVEAKREYAGARKLLVELAAPLPDAELRIRFLERAGQAFPQDVVPGQEENATRRDKMERPGGLTAREWEVVKLVAAGKTNREIAEVLVLGRRTVESHVGNALSKLGFSSRSQLAAWAVSVGNESTTEYPESTQSASVSPSRDFSV